MRARVLAPVSLCGDEKISRRQADALILALSATDEAHAHLQRYGGLTDAPALGAVEAADLLDAARVLLWQAVAP